MDEQIYKVLYLEDNPMDVRFFQEIAKELRGIRIELTNAGTLSEALQNLESNDFDLVVSDLGLPDSMGLYTVKRIMSGFPELPIIVMTTINDEQLGVKAVKLGAQDYLPKGNFDGGLLARSIKYSVERNSFVRRMFLSEDSKFKTLMNCLDIPVVYLDAGLIIRECNPAFLNLIDSSSVRGVSLEEKCGKELLICAQKALEGEEGRAQISRHSGSCIPADSFRCVPVRDDQNNVAGVLCIAEKKQPAKKHFIDLNA